MKIKYLKNSKRFVVQQLIPIGYNVSKFLTLHLCPSPPLISLLCIFNLRKRKILTSQTHGKATHSRQF